MQINKARQVKYFIATLFLTCIFSNLSHAISCHEDVNQMQISIDDYSHITTVDGKSFNAIDLTYEGETTCSAYTYIELGGRYDPRFICTVKWEKGNWIDTLSCLPI